MKSRHIAWGIIGVFVLSVLAFQSPLPAEARGCKPPPFINLGGSDTTQNNLLFILDSSGSMQSFAYREYSGGRLSGTIVSGGPSVTVPWNNNCVNQPSCNYNRRSDCNNADDCWDVPAQWTIVGSTTITGWCADRYECYWRNRGGGRCRRRQVNNYPICWPDNSNHNIDYECDSNGCVVRESDDSPQYINESAYYGYRSATKYYGIFEPTKLYKYDNVNHFFYTGVGSEWDGVGPEALYACDANDASCPGGDKFSGNFLNWLTMRRIDVAKKVLTGGRLGGDAEYWVLVASPAQTNFGGAKIVKDDGDSGYYFTPFHTGMGIVFSNEDPNPLRTPPQAGDPNQGNFVPLITFVGATFTSASRAETGASGTVLSVNSSNPGEPKGDREFNGSYYVAVKVGDILPVAPATEGDPPPQGIIQNFANQMRMGYMRFNYGTGPADNPDWDPNRYKLGYGTSSWDIDGDLTPDHVIRYADGGRIVNRVGDDTLVDTRQYDALQNRIQIPSIVMNINETISRGNTPLAETLREAMNYFQQNVPSYAWVDADGALQQNFLRRVDGANPEWDPYYYDGALQPCTNSYIILVSDGAPTSDTPQDSGCKTLWSGSCTDRDSTTAITATTRFNGSGYLDDIAFKMHTEDQRNEPEMDDATKKENQTVSLYTIYAFGNDSGTRDTLERAALQGGFKDKPYPTTYDGKPGYTTTATDWRYVYPCPAGSTYHCLSDGYSGYIEWDNDGNKVVDHFFVAEDDSEFGSEVEKFITAVITHLVAAGSAAAVATISQETSDGDVIVRGAFTAADPTDDSRAVWNGHLEAYWPTNQTAADSSEDIYEFDDPLNRKLFCGQLAITHDSKLGQPAPSCWDAAELMDRAVRTNLQPAEIFTYVDGDQTDFTTTNAEDVVGLPSPLRRFMRNVDGFPTVNEAKAVIEWVRGEVNDQGQPPSAPTGTTFRNRKGARLGDIVYSTPVIVGPPSLANVPRPDPNYGEFLTFRKYHASVQTTPTIKNKRPKVAYVGANDGMVHAFLMAAWDESNQRWDYKCTGESIDVGSRNDSRNTFDCGDHLWAFIPSNLLGELNYLCNVDYGDPMAFCMHRTMVDLSPKAYDVYIDPDGAGTTYSRGWRTVIIGGERGGGDVYFAIDVTEPGQPIVLWEYSVLNNLAVVYNDSGQDKIALPYRKRLLAVDEDDPPDGTDYYQDDVYFNLKTLPMTWSAAAVGRLRFPNSTNDTSFKFWRYSDPAAEASSMLFPVGGVTPNELDDPTLVDETFPPDTAGAPTYEYLRHIAFIGSGFRIFDPSNLPASPTPDNATIRSALAKPYILALDVETGVNYFQVLWPLVVKARTDGSKLPEQPITIDSVTTKIPWALATPVVVDVWDDANGKFGEDAFVDHMYIGDMRGFMYKIRFNFKDYGNDTDNSNHRKGLDINFWKTKFIPEDDTLIPVAVSSNCDETNWYRGCRQPITVAPSVSIDSQSRHTDEPKLRILFGAGKFDDVVSAGNDDLTDDVKMSFYNAADPIVAPVALTSAYSFTLTSGTPADPGDKVSSSGSTTELATEFTISGTNVGVRYGSGFCGDVGDTTGDTYRDFGCDPVTSTGCRPEAKDAVCGNIADPTDRATCEAECVEITRDPCCCNWLKDCTKDPNDPTVCANGFLPDTCEGACNVESNPSSTCWSCVFDFASESERVIGRSVVFGGYVFFTTYIPRQQVTTTGCTTTAAGVGSGFLYVFDYRCRAFSDNPVPDLGSEAGSGNLTTGGAGGADANLNFYGVKVGLGEGMPSQPVLDSKGENVIIQKSDATLKRIGADTDPDADGKPGDVVGWSER